MRYIFGVMGAALSLQAAATTVVATKIADLEAGPSVNEETLVFLSTGQVARISPYNLELIDKLYRAKEDSTWVSLTLNDLREVISLNNSALPEMASEDSEIDEDKGGYTPSTLGSFAWAKKYFSEMRTNWTKDSQCYNRAHVWAYDWKKNKNYFSSKVFIFFTRKYIRRENFEWWFHVAPYVNVIEEGRIVERVMDRRYLKEPYKMQDWTNFFMKDDAVCPVVRYYSQYVNYPETGSCYLMKSSMYNYQPIDFENEELFGTKKRGWVDWEVNSAYSQAFGVTL